MKFPPNARQPCSGSYQPLSWTARARKSRLSASVRSTSYGRKNARNRKHPGIPAALPSGCSRKAATLRNLTIGTQKMQVLHLPREKIYLDGFPSLFKCTKTTFLFLLSKPPPQIPCSVFPQNMPTHFSWGLLVRPFAATIPSVYCNSYAHMFHIILAKS